MKANEKDKLAAKTLKKLAVLMMSSIATGSALSDLFLYISLSCVLEETSDEENNDIYWPCFCSFRVQ